MQTYIALLRGINVSGQKKMRMADLRALLEEVGLEDVRTYIQSGNVIFRSAKSEISKLKTIIEAAIENAYSFHVDTLVLQPVDLNRVQSDNPFLASKKDEKRFYVTFLFDAPDPVQIEALSKITAAPEEYVLDDTIVYFYSPQGYGRAKMNNNFFEQKLKVAATTRNWRTINTLCAMSQPT